MIKPIFISLFNQDPEVAYQIGYFLGVLIAIIMLIGIPVLFVISLVKAVRKKEKLWIIVSIITGSLLIVPAVMFLYGIYLGMEERVDSPLNGTPDTESRNLISRDSLCQITLPKHWVVMKDLNDEASLQAGNSFREEYMIILSDYKSDFVGTLEDHANVTSQSLLGLLEGGTKSDFEMFEINGLRTLQCEITGVSDLTRIVYLHTTIEGELCYYQVLTWTLPSKMPGAMEPFKEVIPSFKELKTKADNYKSITHASLGSVFLRNNHLQ